ncbi:hypothetical protein EAE96_006710 [Botrytis aclada]|nr:hypothetical protein EAE96_006710 [Botrytis aclada]
MASETPHLAAPIRPLSSRNNELLGEVEHNDELREESRSSSISSSLATPVPVSSRKNDDPQEIGRSSQVIIDASCSMRSAPSCDKAKAKFDEVGKHFPSDLPYIITYENRYLEAICQECDRRLKIEGSAIGGIVNHANGVPHGLNVKKRLDTGNLEESLTSKVMARRKAMENLFEPSSCKKAQDQRNSETDESWEFSSIEVDSAGFIDHSEPGPRKSKRRRQSPGLLDETYKSDFRVSTGLKNPVGRPRGWKKNKDKTSLVDLASAFEEQKEIIDKLTKLLSNAECKLEGQKEVMNNLADLFPGVESKLNEQKEFIDSLALKLERELKRERGTTMNLAELMNNRLDGQKLKIDKLMKESKNFGENGGSKEHNISRIAVDRIVKVEKSIEELNRKLEEPFPAHASEAIMDRVVGCIVENQTRLEEMVREVDKRHSSTRASFTEALETRISSCSSQAAIDRVANLEGCFKEFQKKLASIAGLAVEPQLQRCKRYAELLEKQPVEFRPYVDRIGRLEDNISDFRTFKDKLDNLEACTQGFQKWLDEMAESQTFMERIVNLEKDATNIKHLVEESKVSGESIREYMSKFRSTSDQVTQLKEEVQSYESKLGAVAVALDNRRLQQLKKHTELIENKMSHAQTDFDIKVTRFSAELSDIATQAAKSEMIGKNSSRDHQIDGLGESIKSIMLRLAGLESTRKQSDEMVMTRLVALEKNERQSGEMVMTRLAALEERNEKHVSRILELERGNESLQRVVMELKQPVVE